MPFAVMGIRCWHRLYPRERMQQSYVPHHPGSYSLTQSQGNLWARKVPRSRRTGYWLNKDCISLTSE